MVTQPPFVQTDPTPTVPTSSTTLLLLLLLNRYYSHMSASPCPCPQIPGMVNVDFADVRAIMLGAGTSLMGQGYGTGRDRAAQAAIKATQSPLLDIGIDKATGVVWNITGPQDMTLFEVSEGVLSKGMSQSPLLDIGIDKATGVVWNITGPQDMTLFEVRIAVFSRGVQVVELFAGGEGGCGVEHHEPPRHDAVRGEGGLAWVGRGMACAHLY